MKRAAKKIMARLIAPGMIGLSNWDNKNDGSISIETDENLHKQSNELSETGILYKEN